MCRHNELEQERVNGWETSRVVLRGGREQDANGLHRFDRQLRATIMRSNGKKQEAYQ